MPISQLDVPFPAAKPAALLICSITVIIVIIIMIVMIIMIIMTTRSVQLTYFRATAFSQVRLFLDKPFPPKINVFECELVRFFARAFVMQMI